MKTNRPNIIIGSDHRGFLMKKEIISHLKLKKFKVIDVGTYSEESCDYPVIAYEVAKSVAKSTKNRGILICKSGIGNSIVANKVPGVRAALCYNVKAAQLSRLHNDSNILVLGTDFIRQPTLKKILDTWITSEFEGGRHKRRIDQIKRIEKTMFK